MIQSNYVGKGIQIPTIRGIFVNSHVNAVRKAKGKAGVWLLEMRFGRPLIFRSTEPVPISDEVKLIEFALEMLNETPIPPTELDFEAGRLHFKNFATTPLGNFLLSLFKDDFKLVMLRAPSVAKHIFDGVTFCSKDMGPAIVKVSMSNTAYPPEHFHGVFSEWMHFCGLHGAVSVGRTGDGGCEYTMKWL